MEDGEEESLPLMDKYLPSVEVKVAPKRRSKSGKRFIFMVVAACALISAYFVSTGKTAGPLTATVLKAGVTLVANQTAAPVLATDQGEKVPRGKVGGPNLSLKNRLLL